MGHTTKISDAEFDRAWTIGPECEGYDVEAEAEKSEKSEKSKKVEPEKKSEPTKSEAKTKSK
jgi:hypothetical protein